MPSNYVKKEKKSLLEKIIPRKLQYNTACTNLKTTQPTNNHINPNKPNSHNNQNNPTNNKKIVSKAVVKHKYKSNK